MSYQNGTRNRIEFLPNLGVNIGGKVEAEMRLDLLGVDWIGLGWLGSAWASLASVGFVSSSLDWLGLA